jgi:hypothetical protein
VAIVAELSRAVPPQNIYFVGEPLHYYWLSHLWPGSLAVVADAPAQAVLSATLPLTVTLFVAALFLVVKRFVRETRASVLAVLIALIAFSYLGWLFLAVQIVPGIATLLPNSSPVGYSFLSHSWFRDFLYEPHAVTAVTFALMLLFLDDASRLPTSWTYTSAVSLGLMAGGVLLSDSFLGLLMAGWLTLRCGHRVMVRPAALPGACLAMATLAAFFVLGFMLRMFPSGGGSLTLGVHTMAKVAPVYYVGETGPLFIIGMMGLYRAWREKVVGRFVPVLVLLVLAMALSFTVHVPIEPDIALRKALKILQVTLVVLVGFCLTRGYWKGYVRVGMAATAAAGLVTLFTDLHQYSDLSRSGFPPPTLVADDEMRVYRWMRKDIPPGSAFQMLDQVRPGRRYHDTADWNIVGLGERRSLFANYEQPYLIQISDAALDDRLLALEHVFVAESVPELVAALRKLPPHQLIVNEAAPGPVDVVREAVREGALTEVFRSGRYSVVHLRD